MSHAVSIFGFATRALHAGQQPDADTGARAVPIYQTTSYVFEDTAHAAALFNLQRFGNIYTRIMNPTTAVFEERMASLERGVGALAWAADRRRNLSQSRVCSKRAMRSSPPKRSTAALIRSSTSAFRRSEFRPPSSIPTIRKISAARSRRARACFMGNHRQSAHERAGHRGGAAVAHEHNLPLMIDNTFASPYLCRPIEHGADIVVHSATKFIGGHGTSIGGVIVDSGNFPWDRGRFRNFWSRARAITAFASMRRSEISPTS
jgi:O-acetylhomoserine (thiol)-lyase